jgi:signal transduction histidine kinase
LASGVRQIGENNLGFCLDYQADDEFRAVCDTFNKTASQLEAMVKERQKNENNRKELIAGISHDLRTPLAAIKLSIDGIKSGVAAIAGAKSTEPENFTGMAVSSFFKTSNTRAPKENAAK